MHCSLNVNSSEPTVERFYMKCTLVGGFARSWRFSSRLFSHLDCPESRPDSVETRVKATTPADCRQKCIEALHCTAVNFGLVKNFAVCLLMACNIPLPPPPLVGRAGGKKIYIYDEPKNNLLQNPSGTKRRNFFSLAMYRAGMENLYCWL